MTTGVVTLMWPKDICIAFVFVICGNTPGRLARKAGGAQVHAGCSLGVDGSAGIGRAPPLHRARRYHRNEAVSVCEARRTAGERTRTHSLVGPINANSFHIPTPSLVTEGESLCVPG